MPPAESHPPRRLIIERNAMKTLSTAPGWSGRPFIDYLNEVDRLLHERHGIESVDLEAVAAGQEAGETPQEHADWIAERYDLEPLPQVK